MVENTGVQKYVREQTIVSMTVNSILSGLFAWATFSSRGTALVWGGGGVAFDFLPQTFMIAFMSVLVPTILTRKRMREGRIARSDHRSLRLSNNAVVRALLTAAMAMLVFGSITAVMLYMLGIRSVHFQVLLPGKIVYGALLALLVTPLAVRAALGDRVA